MYRHLRNELEKREATKYKIEEFVMNQWQSIKCLVVGLVKVIWDRTNYQNPGPSVLIDVLDHWLPTVDGKLIRKLDDHLKPFCENRVVGEDVLKRAMYLCSAVSIGKLDSENGKTLALYKAHKNYEQFHEECRKLHAGGA